MQLHRKNIKAGSPINIGHIMSNMIIGKADFCSSNNKIKLEREKNNYMQMKGWF